MTEEEKCRLFFEANEKELLAKMNRISGDISSLMAITVEFLDSINKSNVEWVREVLETYKDKFGEDSHGRL